MAERRPPAVGPKYIQIHWSRTAGHRVTCSESLRATGRRV